MGLLALGLAAQLVAVPPQAPSRQKVDLSARWEPPVLHTTAFLTGLRYIEAYMYPHPFAEGNFEHIAERYRDTFTHWPIFDSDKPAFEWDGDSWRINVIGHGLMGSELYTRARICHFGWAGSLAFAVGSTVAWEYVFEGNGVRPSVWDLVYTPLSGLLLGEARYFIYRTAQSLSSPTARNVLSAIADPFGEMERHWLGSPC
ncbi:DUF3943 domain-containing protein [Pendulispora rubella]|uniref:DUF3943 domain-containing protein n=1 Tax=Pendulispora rubella TaxID=2741070 RepID=A0ABZ2KX14_9BACT